MNLDNVTVELRPRTEWEAADLGARMVRRDARPAYAVWFAITLPMLAIAIAVTTLTAYGGLALFLYWWLEPLTDGPILHIISRRLFGENVGVRDALRQTFSFARRNWIFLLSPYRFHFARSTAIPVTQLENLRGDARRTRAKVLNTRIMNFGTGVSAAYQHLVLSLYFGIMLIAFALLPTAYHDSMGGDWMSQFWDETDGTAQVIQLLVFYVAQSALHPWFVGAGFGLYINCRTRLEAWDIEVAFRRMVQRRAGTATVIALLALVPLMMSAGSAFAQDDIEEDPGFAGYWQADRVDEALETVLEDEALATTEEVEEWQRKNPGDAEAPDETNWRFLENVGLFFSLIVEFGLWILVGLIILGLYATRDNWLPYLEDLGGPARQRHERVMLESGEITAESLPDDIPGTVRVLWQKGERRQALSLLFRGSVFNTVTRYGVRLPGSATEGACIDAVDRQVEAAHSDYFRKVVTAWVLYAYGDRQPAESVVRQLCADWPAHYGEPA